MGFLEYFRKGEDNESAGMAKDRLKVIVAHQRLHRNGPDYLPELQRELMAVLGRYVPTEDIVIALDHDEDLAVLELNVPLPPK
ncbi:cell division topological specificity factor MinE [Ferrimonas balearica]|uniref:cell division topological specificity factor MinE n=1 Tax=Ferrimonas balearica TaxID=44012 RepID=UPI001C99C6CE|nr:cell division topological specificity factor MinE [Ferrimonas balearica]MBY5920591.1 cell division topological specificity factor MinE [Ferrimonas balearica]MBY5996724.1 cell division topological specificity factor MinE [Ferrimonas balearica]